MNIICNGSIAYDYLMTFPGYFKDQIMPEHLDKISLSFLVDSMIRQRGGIAPNIAYTLALLGEKPFLMGTVGEDFEDYRKWLEENGVDCRYVKVIKGEFTASFFANTDLNNNQISSFYTGAMANAANYSMDVLAEKPDLVVISPNDPVGMDNYVEECKKQSIPYLYDPSQQTIRLNEDQLCRGVKSAKSLFVNEYEFELVQKHSCLSAEQIRNSVQILVITLGEKGSKIVSGGKEYLVPAVTPEKILDPTGVGDAYRGGFLKGIALDAPLKVCGELGSVAAAYCLEQRGTQNHKYTQKEFVTRYRKHFDDQGVLDVLLKD